MVGGEVAVSALLADTVPLIPTDHPRFLALADRECQALLAIGLATATASRYQKLLAIAQKRATADPGNAEYQRDLSVIHERLGDLAVAVGDSATAEQHFRADLAIAERLAAADPGNAGYQRDLSISHNKLGELAVAAGDTATADQHFRADLAIAERLAAADPGNADSAVTSSSRSNGAVGRSCSYAHASAGVRVHGCSSRCALVQPGCHAVGHSPAAARHGRRSVREAATVLDMVTGRARCCGAGRSQSVGSGLVGRQREARRRSPP